MLGTSSLARMELVGAGNGALARNTVGIEGTRSPELSATNHVDIGEQFPRTRSIIGSKAMDISGYVVSSYAQNRPDQPLD